MQEQGQGLIAGGKIVSESLKKKKGKERLTEQKAKFGTTKL